MALVVKNPPANVRPNPWVGKIPWRRGWVPTPVFLPGEFQGQRGLAGYSPWGCRVGHDLVTEQQWDWRAATLNKDELRK